MAALAGGGNRSPWEVFYACPSITVDAFFAQVAEAAGSVCGISLPSQAPPAAAQLDAVIQLAKGVQVSKAACCFAPVFDGTRGLLFPVIMSVLRFTSGSTSWRRAAPGAPAAVVPPGHSDRSGRCGWWRMGGGTGRAHHAAGPGRRMHKVSRIGPGRHRAGRGCHRTGLDLSCAVIPELSLAG